MLLLHQVSCGDGKFQSEIIILLKIFQLFKQRFKNTFFNKKKFDDPINYEFMNFRIKTINKATLKVILIVKLINTIMVYHVIISIIPFVCP